MYFAGRRVAHFEANLGIEHDLALGNVYQDVGLGAQRRGDMIGAQCQRVGQGGILVGEDAALRHDAPMLGAQRCPAREGGLVDLRQAAGGGHLQLDGAVGAEQQLAPGADDAPRRQQRQLQLAGEGGQGTFVFDLQSIFVLPRTAKGHQQARRGRVGAIDTPVLYVAAAHAQDVDLGQGEAQLGELSLGNAVAEEGVEAQRAGAGRGDGVDVAGGHQLELAVLDDVRHVHAARERPAPDQTDPHLVHLYLPVRHSARAWPGPGSWRAVRGRL